MSVRVAINGFGRTGRAMFRARPVPGGVEATARCASTTSRSGVGRAQWVLVPVPAEAIDDGGRVRSSYGRRFSRASG